MSLSVKALQPKFKYVRLPGFAGYYAPVYESKCKKAYFWAKISNTNPIASTTDTPNKLSIDVVRGTLNGEVLPDDVKIYQFPFDCQNELDAYNPRGPGSKNREMMVNTIRDLVMELFQGADSTQGKQRLFEFLAPKKTLSILGTRVEKDKMTTEKLLEAIIEAQKAAEKKLKTVRVRQEQKLNFELDFLLMIHDALARNQLFGVPEKLQPGIKPASDDKVAAVKSIKGDDTNLQLKKLAIQKLKGYLMREVKRKVGTDQLIKDFYGMSQQAFLDRQVQLRKDVSDAEKVFKTVKDEFKRFLDQNYGNKPTDKAWAREFNESKIRRRGVGPGMRRVVRGDINRLVNILGEGAYPFQQQFPLVRSDVPVGFGKKKTSYEVPYFGVGVPSIAKKAMIAGPKVSSYAWGWPTPPGAGNYDKQQGAFK